MKHRPQVTILALGFSFSGYFVSSATVLHHKVLAAAMRTRRALAQMSWKHPLTRTNLKGEFPITQLISIFEVFDFRKRNVLYY